MIGKKHWELIPGPFQKASLNLCGFILEICSKCRIKSLGFFFLKIIQVNKIKEKEKILNTGSDVRNEMV